MAKNAELKPDPQDFAVQPKPEKKRSGPLDTPPPIEDPGDADHEQLILDAEKDVERGDPNLPPD
jgi:hypothetical protein